MNRIISVILLIGGLYSQANAQKDMKVAAKFKNVPFFEDSLVSFNAQPLVAAGIWPSIKSSSSYLELRLYTYSGYVGRGTLIIIKSSGDSIKLERIRYYTKDRKLPPFDRYILFKANVKIGQAIGNLYTSIPFIHLHPDTVAEQIIKSHIFDMPSPQGEKDKMEQSGSNAKWYGSSGAIFEIKLGNKYRNFVTEDLPSFEKSDNAKNITKIYHLFDDFQN